jgi:hypothetical protein
MSTNKSIRTVANIMHPDGNVFIRSEFNLIGPKWPVTAFTKKSDRALLRSEYKPGRDVIFAVGTTNPETTRNPDHRSKLLTVYILEPRQEADTKEIVPHESWDRHCRVRSANRWNICIPALRIFQLRNGPPWPDAHDYCPNTYSLLGDVSARGRARRVEDKKERLALMELAIDHEDIFELRPRVREFQELWEKVKPNGQ